MILTNKSQAASVFNELYSKLNESDKKAFSVVSNRLLTDNFIYGQDGYDVDDFRDILRLRNVIEAYFAMIDFDLVYKESYKIFYLQSNIQGVRVKLRKLESVLLLTLAKIYAVKSLEVTSNNQIEVLVTTDDVINEIYKTRIYSQRLVKGDLKSALITLKGFRIIDFKNVNDAINVGLKILPTIIYVVNETDLDDIQEKLNGLRNTTDLEEDEEEGELENEIN